MAYKFAFLGRLAPDLKEHGVLGADMPVNGGCQNHVRNRLFIAGNAPYAASPLARPGQPLTVSAGGRRLSHRPFLPCRTGAGRASLSDHPIAARIVDIVTVGRGPFGDMTVGRRRRS